MHRPDHARLARLTGGSLAEDNGLLARGDRAGYVGPDLQCCGPRGKALKAQIKKRKLVNSLFLLGSPSARLYQGEYLAFPRTPSMANVRVAEDRPGGLLPVSRWSWNQILNAQLAADARMDLCGVEYVDGLAGEMPWTRAHETQNSVLSIRVRGGKITPVPCARVTDACAMSSPFPQDRLVGIKPHQILCMTAGCGKPATFALPVPGFNKPARLAYCDEHAERVARDLCIRIPEF